jgi:DNA-binding ferritin-like protein (Dps family)
MTQITGDDYPTYEDSVNESLKEIAEKTMNKYSNTLQKLSDKPLDRFDLEDRIMGSSQIIDDLENLLYLVGDRPEPATEDEIMNAIIGMIEQSHIRHNRLFNTFASLIEQGTIK